MEQESLFSQDMAVSICDGWAQQLWQERIYESTDEGNSDAFSSTEVKDGRSYFIYGRKVMGITSGGKLKLPGAVCRELLGKTVSSDSSFYTVASLTESQSAALGDILRRMKHDIFRRLIGEVFGCCNDLPECTEKCACVNSGKRLYNGCLYRERMEPVWMAEKSGT